MQHWTDYGCWTPRSRPLLPPAPFPRLDSPPSHGFIPAVLFGILTDHTLLDRSHRPGYDRCWVTCRIHDYGSRDVTHRMVVVPRLYYPPRLPYRFGLPGTTPTYLFAYPSCLRTRFATTQFHGLPGLPLLQFVPDPCWFTCCTVLNVVYRRSQY